MVADNFKVTTAKLYKKTKLFCFHFITFVFFFVVELKSQVQGIHSLF